MKVVEMTNYQKIIKGNVVLDDINMEIQKNQVVGLVGRNASGKTMILRAICGLIKPTQGQILVYGKELTNKNPFPDNIGVVIENTYFWPNYNAFYTLKIIAKINNKIGDEEIKETLSRVGLDWKNKMDVKKFSLGMRKKLSIAQAIMEKPDLLLLDEPTNALDKESVEKFYKIIDDEKKRGATIIIASHIPEDLERCCDEMKTIDNGRILD